MGTGNTPGCVREEPTSYSGIFPMIPLQRQAGEREEVTGKAGTNEHRNEHSQDSILPRWVPRRTISAVVSILSLILIRLT